MDKEITELKILDEILLQFEEKTETTPMRFDDILWFGNFSFKLTNRDKRSVIDKLKEDGYIDLIITKEDEIEEDKYFITFDGLIFLKKDGYRTEYKNESLLNNRLNDINELTLEKLKYDTVTSKRKLKTFWIMFMIALSTVGFSLYNFIVNIIQKPCTEDIRKKQLIPSQSLQDTQLKDTTLHISF